MSTTKSKIKTVGKGNSPAGYAIFPYFTKPDDKFAKNGQAPVYKTGLKLDTTNPSHAAFLERLAKMYADACAAAREEITEKNAVAPANKRVDLKKVHDSDSYMKELLDEEGNATGFVQVNFKLPAQYKAKDGTIKLIKLPLFDARGAVLPPNIDVWGGSKVSINFEGRPYYNAAAKAVGLTLRMNAVQVIELANGKPKDASAFGFGEVEDGFDSSTEGGSAGPGGGGGGEAGGAAGDDEF
jgi:hypothetical protein